MILLFYNVSLFFIDYLTFLWRVVLSYLDAIFHTVIPQAKKSVEGEIVLVTGAGHGLGRELALQFAKLGAKIVCWDVNQESNSKTVTDIKDEGYISYGYQCDVSRREDVVRVAETVRREVGHVTILVNNAGVMPVKNILATSTQEIQRTIDVNLMSNFWTIREFLPYMMSMGRGHVVAMSSIAGRVGTANLVPYCSAKFGVTGLMEALMMEMYDTQKYPDIHLSVVHPIVVNTGMSMKPYSKYPWLLKMIEQDEAVRQIINGVLRNQEVIFIPAIVQYLTKIASLLPRKAVYHLQDFLSYGLHAHDE